MADRDSLTARICKILAGGQRDITNSIASSLLPKQSGWDDLSTVDWRELIEIAQAEGVAPLLYWKIQNMSEIKIPQEFSLTLTQAYYESIAYNTMLFSELQHVLGILQQAEIPVILLKGADLAQTLYPEIGLRPMSDLDLLVPFPFYNLALREIEERLNFHRGQVDADPELQRVVAYHTLLVGGANRSVKLELHWNLIASEESWYAIPVTWYWENAIPFPGFEDASSGKVMKLTNEANLIYIAAHAVLQHGGKQSLLIWYYDIHALVTTYGEVLDWEWLVNQAIQLGWAGVLAKGLQESQARFATCIPQEWMQELERSTDQRLSRLVDFKANLPEIRLLYDWYTLISLKWADRIRYALALIFPKRSYIIQRYRPNPQWIWWLFYPYRWGRMMWGVFDALRKGVWRYNVK